MARRGAAAFVTTPSIFTLHAVTAPMAYLLIADHVDDDTQAIAATVFTHTHRRHLSAPLRPSDGQSAGSSDLSVLARRWDAHPAKLVEAAQRGHGLTCDVVFSMRSRP